MTEPPGNVIDFRREEGIEVISASSLLRKEFGPLQWNIDGILPAGTMLLSGKPKKGKSFLCLLIAISVAAGRPVFGKPTSGKAVLYLALEDSQRRLQRRTNGCMNSLGISPADFGDRLQLSTTSKRIDSGLIDDLRGFLSAYPETGLVVVDMLKKVTGAANPRKQLYDEQAEVGHALTKLCHEYPHLSILVVHHSRKADSEDPFDMISGTTGLPGSFDNLAVIADTEGARVLHTIGRDIEGAEIPLLMNERGMYTLQMPDPEQVRTATMSDTRKRVYEAVPKGQPYKRADIISGSGLSTADVDQQLRLLIKQGYVTKTGRGEYQKTGKRWYDNPVTDDEPTL
jgi:hypothetical protein